MTGRGATPFQPPRRRLGTPPHRPDLPPSPYTKGAFQQPSLSAADGTTAFPEHEDVLVFPSGTVPVMRLLRPRPSQSSSFPEPFTQEELSAALEAQYRQDHLRQVWSPHTYTAGHYGPSGDVRGMY